MNSYPLPYFYSYQLEVNNMTDFERRPFDENPYWSFLPLGDSMALDSKLE
jgi:hypothetical protein